MVRGPPRTYNPRVETGKDELTSNPVVSVQDQGEHTRVILSGAWQLGRELPDASGIQARLEGARNLLVTDGGISAWDGGLLIFLMPIVGHARLRDIPVDVSELPAQAQKLLELALAVPPSTTEREAPRKPGFFERVGLLALSLAEEVRSLLHFVGEATLSLLRLVRGKARFRRSDVLVSIQDAGARALGIVGLISFLVGLILAYMGSYQLATFGAQIYVADLVSLSMLREMAPMMTGIVMAGRTGAAYAAQIGTMMVNEEIDSLRTVGISPIDFLVLPRMLALVLMMPLLTIYADFFGLLGGFLIAVTGLDLNVHLFIDRTFEAVTLMDLGVGLVKSTVIGIIVAVAGCLRGMQCGRSASSVGTATTSAVVTAILLIIIAEAVFAVLQQAFGI